MNEVVTENNIDGHQMVVECNERELKLPSSSEWRASLVPAAAVIPAPRVYINAVDVKKFVVGFRLGFQAARHNDACPWSCGYFGCGVPDH